MFEGMSFREAQKILYLYKLNLQNAQTLQDLPRKVPETEDRAILLVAVEYVDPVDEVK